MTKVTDNPQRLLLVFITLVAATLRTLSVGVPMGQGDEAMNFIWYAFIPWHDLFFEYTDTSQHILTIALARLSMGLFGESEVAYRLPVLLAGIFAVPMLYKLGFHLFDSKIIGLAASGLLTFSFFPLTYSQDGRAYSFTVFFSIVLTCTVIQLGGEKNRVWWGLGFVVSGLAMMLALPTNGFFLAAVTVFFVATYWLKKGGVKALLRLEFLRALAPFMILFVLIIPYLYSIRHGMHLASVLAARWGTTLNWSKFADVCAYLAEPWGLWIYLFFFWGLVVSWRNDKFVPFLMLLATPAVIMLALRLMGPERTNLFWNPFVLLAVAGGLVDFADNVNRRLQLHNRAVFPTILIACLLVQPALKLKGYYQQRFNAVDVTMANARQALEYLKANRGEHQLIVFQDTILKHYVSKLALETNFTVLRDGRLDGIYFLAIRNKQPQDMPLIGWLWPLSGRKSPFSSQSFELVKEIGDVQVHRFTGKISNLVPAAPDPDFETIFKPVNKPTYKLMHIDNLKVVGKSSLWAENNTDTVLNIPLENKFSIEPGTGENVILLIYARKFHLKSEMQIFEPSMDETFYMNFGTSIFTMEDNKAVWQRINSWDRQHFLEGVVDHYPASYWEMQMALYPVMKASKDFTLSLVLGNYFVNKAGNFDGVQAYLLEPMEIGK